MIFELSLRSIFNYIVGAVPNFWATSDIRLRLGTRDKLERVGIYSRISVGILEFPPPSMFGLVVCVCVSVSRICCCAPAPADVEFACVLCEVCELDGPARLVCKPESAPTVLSLSAFYCCVRVVVCACTSTTGLSKVPPDQGTRAIEGVSD